MCAATEEGRLADPIQDKRHTMAYHLACTMEKQLISAPSDTMFRSARCWSKLWAEACWAPTRWTVDLQIMIREGQKNRGLQWCCEAIADFSPPLISQLVAMFISITFQIPL